MDRSKRMELLTRALSFFILEEKKMDWYWNGYCMGLIDGRYLCFESVEAYIEYYEYHKEAKNE